MYESIYSIYSRNFSSIRSVPDTSNSLSLSSILSSFNLLGLSCRLSFIHYNLQNIVPNLDIIIAELSDFDMLLFSEIWFYPSVFDMLLFSEIWFYPSVTRANISFYPTILLNAKIVLLIVMVVLLFILKIIYITLGVQILNPFELECVYLHKHILFGLFYRPSDALFNFSSIENSIHLAVDTGIQNLIVTCDFNYNMLSRNHHRK